MVPLTEYVAAGARAAAAGDFIPVNRVLLGVNRGRSQQQRDDQKSFHWYCH